MTFDFAKHRDRLFFVPLGGSNEIGMNLNLYHYAGKWLMIDMGIGFANDYLPGVEIVVPDIEFILSIKDDLLGIVLTHAHEDHLGAVPYLWRELGCPIYATAFTASLLRFKFAEMEAHTRPKISIVEPGAKWEMGPFGIEYVPLTHSIPEMQAVAITTDVGTVMHTGDWKFDPNPLVGPVSDEARLKAYGERGVLAMVCDSTNVFVEGESGSEEPVRRHLTDLIRDCPQRAVVTTFASNIARLESIIKAGQEAGRIIGLCGRSLKRVVAAASETGYLKGLIEFVEEREMMNISRRDLLLITTGCQGEPRAGLTRMARGDHPSIRLAPEDTVIYSSRRIPGNEVRINWVMNQLCLKRIRVISDKDHYIHVSGHPAREELKHMYRLVKPRIAIPTHGEARHLFEHCKLAREMGVKTALEATNGAVLLLDDKDAAVVGHVPAGIIAIDGASLLPVDGDVLRQRRRLRDDGSVTASVVVSAKGKIEAPIQLSTPGLLDPQVDGELLSECVAEMEEIIERSNAFAAGKAAQRRLSEELLQALRKFFKRELDKKPVTNVHVHMV